MDIHMDGRLSLPGYGQEAKEPTENPRIQCREVTGIVSKLPRKSVHRKARTDFSPGPDPAPMVSVVKRNRRQWGLRADRA